MNRKVTEKAEACISKILDQLGSVKIGDPDYERKINTACTAIHVAVEVINIQEKVRGEVRANGL